MMDNRQRKKKKRTENWSQADKNLLRSLIVGNLKIIENKNCDTNTNKLKKDCWDAIWTLFNEKCETKRRVIQLQFQWRGMKTKARQIKSTNLKTELSDIDAVTNGPPSESPDQEFAEMIDTKPYEFISQSDKFEEDINDPEPQFLFQPKIEESEDNSELGINNITEINNAIIIPSVENSPPRPNSTRPINRKHLRRFKKKNNGENCFKLEIFELTKLHMTEEHEQRMQVLRLEQECRLKELKKLDLEIEMLERK